MEETCPNLGLAEEIIREEDLDVDWIDKENVEGNDNDRAKIRSDDDEVRHLFGSPSSLAKGI